MLVSSKAEAGRSQNESSGGGWVSGYLYMKAMAVAVGTVPVSHPQQAQRSSGQKNNRIQCKDFHLSNAHPYSIHQIHMSHGHVATLVG